MEGMEQKPLHIVIVGHVDHGKSTLVGRLFYDTGSLSDEKLEEIKRAAEKLDRPIEFAYVMDHLEEERKRGITIDIAHTFFSTPKRRYVIIDAPGHKEFLKNMISGTSQADSALLLVDASRGVEEQTLRHCYILGLLGITQVAVLLNKMDLVAFEEDAFEAVASEVRGVLARQGIDPTYIIPTAAITGENIARRREEKLSWFTGPTVIEALDSFTPIKVGDKDLRFPVQDIYDLQEGEGGILAAGRVEAGVLKKGQTAVVLPEGKKTRVLEIKKYMKPDLPEAETGECVGIRTEDGGLKRGDVLVGGKPPTVSDSIHANIFWMVDVEYEPGRPLLFRCATQEATARIERILKRFDPAKAEFVESDARTIRPAEVAEVEIRLDAPVAVDRFSDIPELGRFVLEYAGRPVAGGIII